MVQDSGYGTSFMNWVLGVILIYAFLYRFGQVIFKNYLVGFITIGVGIATGALINHNLKKVSGEI